MSKPAKSPRAIPGMWARFAHFTPYRKSNSIRGLDEAKRLGYKAIDLDLQATRDGVPIVTHWSTIDKDGFSAPGIPRGARFSDLTWAQVSRLRSRDGYRVHTARAMIRMAHRRGLRVELEAKQSAAFEHVATWLPLARTVRRTGADVQVKTLSTLGKPAHRLRAAHEAGFTTILLPRGTLRARREWWPFIDYVRGPVFWVDAKPSKSKEK